MSIHSFWIIVLKIFGIYVLLTRVPELIITSLQIFSFLRQSREGGGDVIVAISFLLLMLSLILFVLNFLLFKPERIIDAFALERAIKEEKLEFNMHRSTILTITIIVAGLIIFIDSLPLLIEKLYGYYQQINSYQRFKDYRYAGQVISELMQVLISFFMITSSRLIVNFIERKRKGKVALSATEE